jgi:membrane protease subunit HflK
MPFDPEDLIRQGQDRFEQMMPSGGAGGFIVVAILVLAGLALWTAFYTVPSDSVAVVQRFGRYLEDVPPGLQFKLPLGIDTATIVPVKRQLKQEFGFSTPGASDPYQSPRDGRRETEMVTGDLNAALVEWVVQYRISDPAKFLFEVRKPSETLRYVSESVMREVVGDRTVDEVITVPTGDRVGGADQDAGALHQVRDGDQHRPGAVEEHQSARAGAGVVQRGQPGPAGEGEADQRGPARLQQGDSVGRG